MTTPTISREAVQKAVPFGVGRPRLDPPANWTPVLTASQAESYSRWQKTWEYLTWQQVHQRLTECECGGRGSLFILRHPSDPHRGEDPCPSCSSLRALIGVEG